MVEVINDNEGKVVAYIDMSLRDRLGNRNPMGDCMYIHHMWIHQSLRHTGAWKQFLNNALIEFPWLHYVYWERSKHNKRSKTVSIEQLKRR